MFSRNHRRHLLSPHIVLGQHVHQDLIDDDRVGIDPAAQSCLHIHLRIIQRALLVDERLEQKGIQLLSFELGDRKQVSWKRPIFPLSLVGCVKGHLI